MSTWTELELWYEQLPTYYAAAAGLITNPAGDVLLVKPTYRDGWNFPGGCVEPGEYPHDACTANSPKNSAPRCPPAGCSSSTGRHQPGSGPW